MPGPFIGAGSEGLGIPAGPSRTEASRSWLDRMPRVELPVISRTAPDNAGCGREALVREKPQLAAVFVIHVEQAHRAASDRRPSCNSARIEKEAVVPNINARIAMGLAPAVPRTTR